MEGGSRYRCRIIDLLDSAAEGRPWTSTCRSLASSAAIERNDLRSPVLGLRRRSRFTSDELRVQLDVRPPPLALPGTSPLADRELPLASRPGLHQSVYEHVS